MRQYLLVDDNRPFLENLGEIVEDEGDAAVLATRGAEAVCLIAQRTFDALVTDMRMPGMSGAELIHRARALDPGLPIVLLSAYAGQGELEASVRDGLVAVLPKPVPIEELLRVLASARRKGVIGMIEDDVVLSDHLAALFAAQGYASVRAFSVKQLERLHGSSPFVILVDLLLPDSPRGEVLALVEARFPGVPLVVMTGAQELARELFATHTVLEKPFDAQALAARLARLHAASVRR